MCVRFDSWIDYFQIDKYQEELRVSGYRASSWSRCHISKLLIENVMGLHPIMPWLDDVWHSESSTRNIRIGFILCIWEFCHFVTGLYLKTKVCRCWWSFKFYTKGHSSAQVSSNAGQGVQPTLPLGKKFQIFKSAGNVFCSAGILANCVA
jgi:hypothetical protein